MRRRSVSELPPLPAQTSTEWTEGANIPNKLNVAAGLRTSGPPGLCPRLCGGLALLVVSTAQCGWVVPLGTFVVVHDGAVAIVDAQLRHGVAQLVLPGVAAHFLVEYVLEQLGRLVGDGEAFFLRRIPKARQEHSPSGRALNDQFPNGI